jgi:Secretion system C-terminal sorting domain
MSKTILDVNFFKKSISIVIFTLFFSFLNSAINIITPLPTNLTKCQGDSLILNISLTSDHAVDFTWKRNGSVIGSNSSSLVLPVLSTTDTGTYTCEIKEQISGATNIQTCIVAINPKPVIIEQITGTSSPLCVGGNLNLGVDILNATLVWRLNGSVLSVGSPLYSKMGVTAADTGNYTVLAKALIGCRDTISNAYNVSIRQRAFIIDTPKGAKLRDASLMSHVMRIKVGGDGPFAYQWYKDGTAIPGANEDSFKIYSYTTAADSGAYRVIVNTTIPCSDTLRSKLLLVEPTLCPILLRQTDTLLNACMGGAAIMEVDALGVARYQWFKVNASGTQDSLEGAIYNRFIIANADSTSAGFYNLTLYKDPAATGDCQEKDLVKRIKVVLNPRQSVTVQPIPNANCAATSHTLSVRGKNATMYQWYKNGAMIPGATDSNYTISPLTTIPDEYRAHVRNPYCTDEPSNTVLVRQLNPNNLVKLAISDKLNLMEQCTDNAGWTYYAHDGNKQELLLAIKKNGNNVVFSPDVRFTNGFIKELEPTTIEKKVVLMGLRMFSIKLKDSASGGITNPYSVRFFYNEGPSEKGLFLSTIQARKNTLSPTNEFSTDLPTDQLSFVISTQNLMTSSLLLNEKKAPISFPYQVVTDKTLGSQNSVAYVEVNNMVTPIGGGTFYFQYQRKAGSGIQSVDNTNFDIYPIPASGNLTVRINQIQKVAIQVRIIDLLGREVKTLTIDKFEAIKNIDCSDLPAGNYILNLDKGTEQFNEKIVIER